ncbi:MAG: LppX_LprAFG lipoprotein [Actinomycetota bacterium]|nr:LppX_LprAFG lipoprotein [Actinomycetota bacterium]
MRPARVARTPRPTAPAAVAAMAALALALTGCASDSGDAGEIVRNAPDKTAAAGSARVAIDVSFSSSASPSTVTGEGIVDLEDKRGSLALDIGALGAGFGASSLETYLGSDGIFVRLPPTVLPGSRPWLKLDLATLATQAGVNFGSLGQLQSADPSQALQFLKGAVDDMDKVGDEEVRGTDTDHYRGTLDLDRAAASVSEENRGPLNEAKAALGTSRIPTDVWIDDEGRMRKMRMALDPDGDGPTPAGSVQFEMFDFGVEADIQPPPPDQVSDLSTLVGGLPRS